MKLLKGLLALASLAMAAPVSSNAPAVPNSYVAMMTSGMAPDLFEQTMSLVQTTLGTQGQLGHTYNFFSFRGFSFQAPPAIMNAISAMPGVEEVHADYLGIQQHQNNVVTTTDPTGYALDRISHHQYGANSNRKQLQYRFDEPAGEYVTTYVVDGGVRVTHRDLGGRATLGPNYAPDNVLPGHAPRENQDYTNHGTPIAGLIAGSLYGVAKRSNIVSVRIFNDNGTSTLSGSVAALQYCAEDASNRNAIATSVVNYSAGGENSGGDLNLLNYAVQDLIDHGLFIAVSAGNSRTDVADFAPASVADACTVGGTDFYDREYYYSNYGRGVDIWAPGDNITAPSDAFDFGVAQVTGTSFSTPLVAGVAALLKSFGPNFSSYNPVQLCNFLASIGTRNQIRFQQYADDIAGPNIILFNDS